MPTGEVDTSAITEAILASGKRPAKQWLAICNLLSLLTIRGPPAGKNLFVPKVDVTLPGGMDFLRIHNEEDLRSLPEGVWGIKEPQFQYQDAPRSKGM
jgi:hypothetical protein